MRTAEQYEKFMAGVREAGAVCHHGHFHCAMVEGGRCCDEEFAWLPEAEQNRWYDEFSGRGV